MLTKTDIAYVYKIISPTKRVYIGESYKIQNRKKLYESGGSPSQRRLFASLQKYGWEKHRFEIVEICKLEDRKIRERYWQDKYNVLSSKGLNCRLTPTETSPQVLSEETKRRIGKANSNPSEETRQKMRKFKSEKHKASLRKSKLGKTLEEIMGKEKADEVKRKQVERQTGTKHRQDTLDKMSLTRQKVLLEKNGWLVALDRNTLEEKLRFISPAYAAKELGISGTSISDCIYGRQKAYAGYIWRYVKEM